MNAYTAFLAIESAPFPPLATEADRTAWALETAIANATNEILRQMTPAEQRAFDAYIAQVSA